MTRVPELLEEVLIHLRSLSPEIAESFFPPASQVAIQRLLKTTRQPIPPDLQAFWRTTNGQDHDAPGIFDGDFIFLSVENALQDWSCNKIVYEKWEQPCSIEVFPGVQSKLWLPGWIPFAWSRTGDTLCVDMCPAQGGEVGQVILTTVAGCIRARLSASFEEWLELLVRHFRLGRFSRDPKCMGALLHDRQNP
jgi:cell wall assembly regulator SMI1